MKKALASKAKGSAIIDGLTRLAAGYRQELTAEALKVYTSVLIGLTPEELETGFRRALRETKWWPKPAELLEFCTGRSPAMANKLLFDQAWKFICECIERFGVDATTQWKLQGYLLEGQSIEAAMHGCPRFAVSAPFYEVTRYDPPKFPDLVNQTLLAMGGTQEIGLRRIADALKCKGLAKLCSGDSKEVSFVRKDFDEYFSRALAADDANRPKTMNPALQLPGAPGPAFPRPSETVIAYRIRRTRGGYEADRLSLEEATRLYGEGALTDRLYEETLSYWREVERKEAWWNTPVELVAVCTGKPHRHNECSPKLAYFAVENAGGTEVIFDSLTMAVGDLDLNTGDIIRFTAKPAELRCSEPNCYAFDPSNVFNLGRTVTS